MRITRDKLKITLANQGIRLKVGHINETYRTIGFSYPKLTTFKSKLDRVTSKDFNEYLNNIKVETINFTDTVTPEEVNAVVFKQKFKHSDYRYNSFTVTHENYKKICDLAYNYNLSRSKVIKFLVESM